MESLFDSPSPHATAPLAARSRPLRLSDVVGHDSLLAPSGVLRQLILTGRNFAMVLGGPPGVGKTSLARLVASEMVAYFMELSATTAGVKDIKDAASSAKRRREIGDGETLCFIDEIHRFSRTQQDALLAPVEEGSFSLLGATTENPYVTLSPALLSRVTVVRLNPLREDELVVILQRAAPFEKVVVSDGLAREIALRSHGDARRSLGVLEAVSARKRISLGVSPSTQLELDETDMDDADFEHLRGNDKSTHYELTSALIKSMRASDTEGAMYYLARLLVAGEPPQFIARRLAIFASEDVGPANNQALAVANATYSLVEKVGMPESRIILSHAVLYLSSSVKSRLAKESIEAALGVANLSQSAGVPAHLRGTISEIESSYLRGRPSPQNPLERGVLEKEGESNLPKGVKGGFLPRP